MNWWQTNNLRDPERDTRVEKKAWMGTKANIQTFF